MSKPFSYPTEVYRVRWTELYRESDTVWFTMFMCPTATQYAFLPQDCRKEVGG